MATVERRSQFWFDSLLFLGFSLFKWEGRKKRRKKKASFEGFKKSKVWNLYVWNFGMEPICMETICMEIPLCLCWVRKTLTHNKGVFGWFKFIFEG